MNREIYFRLWDIKNTTWLYIKENDKYFICPENGCVFDTRWGDVIDSIIHRFTGLYDKNKNRIYEGDIIKIPKYNGEVIEYGTIIFDNGCFKCLNLNYNERTYIGDYDSSMIEIVGNIIDNKELLDFNETDINEL